MPWNLAVAVDEVDTDGFRFSGYVVAESYGPGNASGIRVVFRDGEHEVRRAVPLGNLTGNDGRTESLDVSLDEIPTYVVVRLESDDSGDSLELTGTEAFEIEPDGTLRQYELTNRSEYVYDE